MKYFTNYIKRMPDSNFQFYGTLISLLLLFSAIYLNIKWFDSKTVSIYTNIIVFIAIIILIYVIHFRNVEPLWHSITLSLISAFFTGAVTILYLKYFKQYSGVSMPIALISQNIISKYIKKFFNISNL
jgi:hypothetical protein